MTAVAALLLLPLLWSALVFAVRAPALRGGPALSDTAEKTVLLLMLAPLLAAIVLPVLPVSAPAAMTHILPGLPDFEPAAVSPAAAPMHHSLSAVWLWPRFVFAFWAVGAGVTCFRLGRAHLRFARVAATAEPAGDGVYLTPADVPAFAWNHRTIVVPIGLQTAVTAEQFGLIVAHERAHQKRGDPVWFLMLGLIQSVLWFNPFLRLQARACRLAAELACDAAVTRAAPEQRRTYAEALVRIVAHGANAPATVPALSDLTICKTRLETIMTRTTPPKAVITLTALLCLAVPAVSAEIAFAKGAPAPLAAAVPPVASISAPAFIVPVDGTAGEAFGMRKNPIGGEMKFHEGVDFVAPLGTPVKASAAGTVSFAGDQPGFGTTVEIDHGSGTKTRYAHLSRADVKAGDTVAAGQDIGAVGTTGISTSTPHLHFEIWQDGKPVNPAPLLGITLSTDAG